MFLQHFAQRGHQDWNHSDNYSYRDHGHDYNNTFIYNGVRYWTTQRDKVIHRIDVNYDYQIQRVANDWDLSQWRKRKIIDQLQDRKAADIRSIYAQCNEVVYHDRYRENHHDGDGYHH